MFHSPSSSDLAPSDYYLDWLGLTLKAVKNELFYNLFSKPKEF